MDPSTRLVFALGALEVVPKPGREVVERDDLVDRFGASEPLTEIGSDETCAASDHYTHKVGNSIGPGMVPFGHGIAASRRYEATFVNRVLPPNVRQKVSHSAAELGRPLKPRNSQ